MFYVETVNALFRIYIQAIHFGNWLMNGVVNNGIPDGVSSAVCTYNRIIGVDVAKIVAMFLVVAVHVNGFGLPYSGNGDPDAVYLLTRAFMGALFMTCIDIFAIASGYVGITSRFSIRRLIRLWVQIVFTGLAICACIDFFTDIQVPLKDYGKACIPIAKKQYWYMTCYMMLACIMPLVNSGIRAMPQSTFRKLTLGFLFLICGESFLLSGGVLGVDSGFSFEWLLVLYCVGAHIRLYGERFLKSRAIMLVAIMALTLSAMGAYLQEVLPIRALVGNFKFVGYTSPFTLALAVCIFIMCIRIQIQSNRIVGIVTIMSSATLGVYLIHTQPIFFNKILQPTLEKMSVADVGSYLITIISSVVSIYLVSTVLDYVRGRIFKVIEKSLQLLKHVNGRYVFEGGR